MLKKLNKLLGLRTIDEKRDVPEENSVELQDMVVEDGQLRTREGFLKYNTSSLGSPIKGMYDYKGRWGVYFPIFGFDGSMYVYNVMVVVCDASAATDTAFTLTATVYNQGGGIDYNYNGTCDITHDGAGSLNEATLAFTNGVGVTTTIEHDTVELIYITLTDQSDTKIYGSDWINITAPPQWTEASTGVGGLGSGLFGYDLLAYNDKIYVLFKEQAGSVYYALYEYNGTDTLTKVAPSVDSGFGYGNTFVVYDSKIYGRLGYRIYYWNDSDAWVEGTSSINYEAGASELLVYDGELYWNEVGYWGTWDSVNGYTQIEVDTNPQTQYPAIVFNGKLYSNYQEWGVGYALTEWDDVDTMVIKSNYVDNSDQWSFMVEHNSTLYIGTTGGNLLEWNGTDTLTEVAPSLDSKEISHMITHSGSLYAVNDTGDLLVWNGSNAWTKLIEETTYTDTSRLLSFNGILYGLVSAEDTNYVKLVKYV